VAKRALKWVTSIDEVREKYLSTFQQLWAKIVQLGGEEEFEENLMLLAAEPSPENAAMMVKQVLLLKVELGLTRVALQWLSKYNPASAVKSWPLLMKTSSQEAPKVKDMKDLLDICEKFDLEVPKIPQVNSFSKAMPPEMLQLLVDSKLPEARLIAIEALREKADKKGFKDGPLKALCYDSCNIVRGAARDVWVWLGGKDEDWQKKKSDEGENQDDDEDED